MSSHSVLRHVIQPKTVPPSRPNTPFATNLGEAHHLSPRDEGESDLEMQLGILVENAPVALSMFDKEMRYIVANRLWIEEFGLQQVQPLIGRSQYEIFPGLHPGWRQVYDRALQGHVVRSEHDAISGQDGRPIVYRWEVRPWRQKADASVGGLVVICEKFAANLEPFRDSKAPAASNSEMPSHRGIDFFQASVPMVILDETGRIVEANDAASRLLTNSFPRDGEPYFWQMFGEGSDPMEIKSRISLTLLKLGQEPESRRQSITTMPSISSEGEPVPSRWMFTGLGADSSANHFAAIALPSAPHPCDETAGTGLALLASHSLPHEPTSIEASVLDDLQETLNKTRQEVTVLREAELSFAKREARQRAVLEALACGIVVLDERGMPIYHNQHIANLLGRTIQRGESVEQWLMQACTTQAHKENVAGIWAQDVWSRQLTRILSLATADGLLKELEFRPLTLSGGGVLVSIHDVTDQCRIDDLLQSTEAKFKALLQENPSGVVLVDKGGAVFEVNRIAEEMLGFSKSDIRRMVVDEWLSPESAAARKEALKLMRDEGRRSASIDVQIRHASGRLCRAGLRIALVNDAEGQPHCTVHFLQLPAGDLPSGDGSPPQSSSDLRTPLPVLSPPANPAPADVGPPTLAVRWLMQTDPGGRIANWSADAAEVFGFEASEIQGSGLHCLFRPSDPTGFYADLQEKLPIPDNAVTWSFFGKEGRRGKGRFFVKPVGEGMNSVDVFEEHEIPGAVSETPSGSAARTHLVKPSQLWPVADLDREKLLLSETHHRIKNHLQIISSMLNLQLNSLADQEARAALRSSQNRVRAIAALHQHLHELSLGGGPGFAEFATGLADRLRKCYDVPEEQVSIRLEITATLVQQEWMMPLALILNETLSNAFEHAFPENRKGSIIVCLALNDGLGEFEVTDNGKGLPEGFDPAIAPGLGLKILGVFAEQMRGELRLAGDAQTGTKFNLRFPIAHIDN